MNIKLNYSNDDMVGSPVQCWSCYNLEISIINQETVNGENDNKPMTKCLKLIIYTSLSIFEGMGSC